MGEAFQFVQLWTKAIVVYRRKKGKFEEEFVTIMLENGILQLQESRGLLVFIRV